jgi:phytoene dehydrogenase-like protein
LRDRVFQEYGEDLIARGLEFAPASHCFASVFDDGKWMGVSTGVGETRARVAAFSEADAKTWDRLCSEFPGTAEYVFALLGNPMQMQVQGKLLAKALFRKGFAWTADLVRMLLSSPRKWLSETFESEHVRTTMAAWGMHLDFAPDMAGGAVFPYLESMANQHFGMVIGKGGADTVTQALVSKIEASGGEVHCGKRRWRGSCAGRQQGHRYRACGRFQDQGQQGRDRQCGAPRADVASRGNPAMQDLTARWSASSMRPAR